MKRKLLPHKQGSIILMMLFLIITLSVLMCSSLRTVSYYTSLAKERENYEVNYQIACSLHNFALQYLVNKVKDSTDRKITIFDGPWPDQKSIYNGTVIIHNKKLSTRTLNTAIIKNNQKMITLCSFF